MKTREAVIIGGGLAGAAAATRLVEGGIDVLLIEKELTPHHKVCGEFISAEACGFLQELGIDLTALGAQPIDRLQLTSGKSSALVALGFRAQSLSRLRLDQALLQQARQQGAELREANVTGLAYADRRWQIQLHNAAPVYAKTVFLANGKHELRGWQRPAVQRKDYIGLKCHFRLSAEQQAALTGSVELFLFDGGYAGLEAVEDGLANLCLIVTAQRFAACGKTWDGVLGFIARQTPLLAARMASAQACWDRPLAVSGIPYGFVYRPARRDPPNLFRLGDQLAVIPSLCGDGMAIALYSGLLAVRSFYDADCHSYHRTARRQLLGQIRTATTLSTLLATAPGRSLAPLVCRLLPSITRRLARQTRVAAPAPQAAKTKKINRLAAGDDNKIRRFGGF